MVQGGFPKPAKRTLSLSLRANKVKDLSFRAFGKMALVLKRGASITFRGHCNGTLPVRLSYWLITTDCVGLIDTAENDSVLISPDPTLLRNKTKTIELNVPCQEGVATLNPLNLTKNWEEAGAAWRYLCGPDEVNATTKSPVTTNVTTKAPPAPTKPAQQPATSESAPVATTVITTKIPSPTTIPTMQPKPTTSKDNKTANNRAKREVPATTKNNSVVCITRTADVHAFIVLATVPSGDVKPDGAVDITLNVEMKNPWGYLSAVDHPNLVFFGFMTGLYSVYAFAWLILLMVQYRDLLRIQFWIGGVIALGMIEKALFFSEYNAVNLHGRESAGLMVFAELVSTGKRTLARLLVIIVSMGFGIVKPRLGPMLPRVLAVGVVYFVASAVDSTGRALHDSEKPTDNMATTLVLTVIDAGICWWIFLSLHGTMRTLRLRRNLTKLSLYRHFTNTLIFAVIASVAFMFWTLRQFRLPRCVNDWSELWLRAGFWHILFSFILLIIMILWRPTANNNRYAYSPLIDLGSNDDDPEQMPSDAFEGMKLRNVGGHTEKKQVRTVEDDLKWVEENIPTATAENALPSLLDSDEELMTTKFEMSKIQ